MPIPAALVFREHKSRRRLVRFLTKWGPDEPPGYVGTDLRLFGGYNYGYKLPGDSRTKDGRSVVSLVQAMTVTSWSVFIFAVVGALTISVPGTGWLVLFGFLYNEFIGYTGRTQRSEYRDNTTGAVVNALVAFMNPTTVTRTDFEYREISGASMMYNIVAAYAPTMYLMGNKVGYLGALSSLPVIASDIYYWLQDQKKPVEQRVVNHYVHFLGLGIGAWFTYMISGYITTSTAGLVLGGPVFQFLLGMAWTLFNLAPYSGTALQNAFEPVPIQGPGILEVNR